MDIVNRQSYLDESYSPNMTTFGERLKEARKDRGLSQASLAKIVGLKQPTIAELESDGKGSSKAALIAKALGVSAVWLSEGKGDKKEKFDNVKVNLTLSISDSVDIPLLAAKGSMGDGNETPDPDLVVDVLRITRPWLDKTLTSVSDLTNLRFIHAMGDSMMPTFNDGDILLVDAGTASVTVDGVYVLSAHDRLFIKRVRRRLDGQFEISSDNISVKTVDVLNGDHEVQVKGRVVWVWNGKRV